MTTKPIVRAYLALFSILYLCLGTTPQAEAYSVVYLDGQGEFTPPPKDFRKRVPAPAKLWWTDLPEEERIEEPLPAGGLSVRLRKSEYSELKASSQKWSLHSKATGTTITILAGDGPDEGFNDPTPTDPIGGNPGSTLGEQRRIAFEQAASLWADHLVSRVEIEVVARFDPLTCGPNSGVLGAAGPDRVVRDFDGAPLAHTWYTIAQANSLAGRDLLPDDADIDATFNSLLDNNTGCLGNTDWYYGLDGNAGGDIDLVSVLLHEFGHGLGFLTLVSSSGEKFRGYDDVYMLRLQDASLNLPWTAMTANQRYTSSVDTGDLVWSGPAVTSQTGGLQNGVHSDGKVEIHAPATYDEGSSVSHFSNAVSPNDLMEPSYTGPKNTLGLAVPLMADLGWAVVDSPVVPSQTPSRTGTPTPTRTNAPVSTPTQTPVGPTATPSTILSRTATATAIAIRTYTPLPTARPSPTATRTVPPKPTPSATSTPTMQPARVDARTLLELLSEKTRTRIDWFQISIRWDP